MVNVSVHVGPPCHSWSGEATAEEVTGFSEPAPEPGPPPKQECSTRGRSGTAERGGLAGPAPPAAALSGGLPPAASSSGKRWYAFLAQHPEGPSAVGGSELAIRLLGGSWLGHGRAPRGFATLEEAIAEVAAKSPLHCRDGQGIANVTVRFR